MAMVAGLSRPDASARLTGNKMHAPSNASAPGVRLRNRSDTYADITEFLFDEAELLDGLRFDAWAALLAPDLSYRVPLRVTRSRSEEHTSELQSLMRISYAVFCLKKKKKPMTNDLYSDHYTLT